MIGNPRPQRGRGQGEGGNSPRMKDKKPPAPATVVLLVRHGLTATTGVKLPGRARGLHISDEGRKQAEATAARIAKVSKLVAVYSSPLERARETAQIIAKARGMVVRIDRGLLELDIGKWTGMAIKDAVARPEWRPIQQHPSGFRFDGGESYTEMQARITGAIARIVARHSGRATASLIAIPVHFPMSSSRRPRSMRTTMPRALAMICAVSRARSSGEE